MTDPAPGAESATPPVEGQQVFVFERFQTDWLAHRAAVRKFRKENGEPNWLDDIFLAEHCSGTLADLKHFSHPTFILAPKKSVLGQSLIANLLQCGRSHSDLVICHGPGLGTAIDGIMQNSVSILDGTQVPYIFGGDQKAAAEVITLGIHYGILPQDPKVQRQLIIGFQIYRDHKTDKMVNMFDTSVDGCAKSMVRALTGGTPQAEALAACGKASHPFCPDVVPHPYPAIPADEAE